MDTNKLLMQWKGPYEIMSRCGKGNDYQVEVNRKMKTFYTNMLKKYIERADQDGAPQQNSSDNQVMFCDVYTEIIRGNEDLGVNDDEMMELADCHQKETVQDVKLGIEQTKTQQQEMMNTLARHKEVFSDIPSKTNMIKHKIEFTDNNPVRSRPYPLPYASVVQLLLAHGPLYKNMMPCRPFQTNVTRLKIKQEQIQIYKI